MPGKMSRIRLAGFVIACFLLLVGAVGAQACSGPTENREDAFTVSGNPIVVIENENGDIDVIASDQDEVTVQAVLRDAPRVDYDVSQVGNSIRVNVKVNRDWWEFYRNPGADVTVTVPASCELQLDTSNGGIEVRGTRGTGNLRSSNGPIALSNVRGNFTGSTSNGRIEIDQFEGKAGLSTSNGRITARMAIGEFDLETSNGDVLFSGNLTAGEDNYLETSNGDVDVELGPAADVYLDASTSNGKISTEQPVFATITEEDRLVGKIGDGRADLYIRTSNGDITIR